MLFNGMLALTKIEILTSSTTEETIVGGVDNGIYLQLGNIAHVDADLRISKVVKESLIQGFQNGIILQVLIYS